MKYKFIIVLIFNLFISCNNRKDLSSKEERIIKNCVIRILNTKEGKNIDDCYLVNPYFDSFSIDDHPEKTKEILFEKFHWKKEEFSKLKNEINAKYNNYYSELLGKYSTCDESYAVFTFAGIYNNLVCVKLIDNYGKVNFKNIQSDYEFEPSQVYFYLFILDNNGDITEVLQHATYYD